MPEDPESRATADRRAVARRGHSADHRVQRTLIASLSLAYLPVVFLLVTALGAFVYAVAVLISALGSIIGHPFPAGHHIGSFLLVFDLFLIGSTALISAIGFYELFIGDIRRNGVDALPGWLAIHDLNELKSRVVSMIVLVLAVTFAEEAVDSPGGLYILELGGGIFAIILALTVFLRYGSHADASPGDASRGGHDGRDR